LGRFSESRKYSAIKYYWVVHALNYFLPLFSTFYSRGLECCHWTYATCSGLGGYGHSNPILVKSWKKAYNIYLSRKSSLQGCVSNTLHNVCTIHSMWKSQKFLKTIKHWRFILRPHLPLLISIIYDIFLDKYTLLYDLYYTLVLNTIDPSECPSYDIASVTSKDCATHFSVFERITNIAMIW